MQNCYSIWSESQISSTSGVFIMPFKFQRKSYGLLITFSLIMMESPRLLCCCPPGKFFCWMVRGDHPKTFLLKALKALLKVMGGGNVQAALW